MIFFGGINITAMIFYAYPSDILTNYHIKAFTKVGHKNLRILEVGNGTKKVENQCCRRLFPFLVKAGKIHTQHIVLQTLILLFQQIQGTKKKL